MENEVIKLIMMRKEDVIVVFQAEAGAEAPGRRADLEIVVTDCGAGPAPRLRGVSVGQRHAERFLRMSREGRGQQPQDRGNSWERRHPCRPVSTRVTSPAGMPALPGGVAPRACRARLQIGF